MYQRHSELGRYQYQYYESLIDSWTLQLTRLQLTDILVPSYNPSLDSQFLDLLFVLSSGMQNVIASQMTYAYR